MEYNEILQFIKSIENYSDEEIVKNIDYIREYLRNVHQYDYAQKFSEIAIATIKDIDIKSNLIIKYFFNNELNQRCDNKSSSTYNWQAIITVLINSSDEDRKKVFINMFKNIKFQEITRILNIPRNLKFGIEIEVTEISFENIKRLFENNMIYQIMEALGIPEELANRVITNTDFEKENQFDKWIFSKEGADDYDPEASSPIMKNTLEDINQIGVICTLFRVLGAKIHGGTGLHINIGEDYLEHREDAIKNLLIIWSECEELFFKISNEENDEIRAMASTMAVPIKENIEKTLNKYGDIKLDTQENIEKFIYNIQAQNRLGDLLGFKHGDLEFDLMKAKTDEQKYDIYRRYMEEKEDDDTAIRYTSINFNHITWNKENNGRIEFRLFNSTLSPKVIMQNLLLTSKLCEVSLEIAKNSHYKEKEFEKLLCHDLSEEEKLDSLLDLLFENEEEKDGYKNRWMSVKDKKTYKRFRTGTDTFCGTLNKSLPENR